MQRKAWEEDDFSLNTEMTKLCIEIRGDPTQLKQRNRLKDLLGQSDISFSKFFRYCCRQANTVYRTALTLPTPATSTTSTTSSSSTTTVVAVPSTTSVLTVEHIAEIASWSSTIIDVIKLQGHGDMSKKYSKLCDLTFLIDSIKRQGFVDANRLLNIYQLVKVLISNQATELEKVYKVPIHVHSTILIKSTPSSSKPISNVKEDSNNLTQTSKSTTGAKVKSEERPKKSMGESKSSQPPSDTFKQRKLKTKKKVKSRYYAFDSDDEEEAEDRVSSADEEEEEDLNEDLFGEDDDKDGMEGGEGQSDSEDDGANKKRKSRDRKRQRLRSDVTTTHLSHPSSDKVKSKPEESTTTIHWSSDPHAHMTNAKVKSILEEGWREVSLLDTGGLFETKVTEDIAPNYFDHIRHPMDLGTIHKSIMTNDTYSLHTLDHDIMLMLSNCVKYNSIYNPDLVPYAKYLKSAWIAIRTDLLHRITYTEYISTNSTTTIPKDILNPRLRAAWEEVTKQDPMQIFAYPVTDAIAPGYTRMIKEPMDLGTILKKLNKSVYTNLSGFDKDMELIFKNCIRYNGIHTTYGKLAVKLQNVWREQRRFIELDSMKSPSSSTLPSSVSTASELTPVPVKASSSAAAVSASVSLNTHTKDISSTSSHTNNTQSTIPLYTDTDTDASTSYKSTKMLSSNPPPSTSTPSSKQANPSSDKVKSKPEDSTNTTETTTTIHWSSDPHAHMTNAKVKSILEEGWREVSLLDTGGLFETKVTEDIAPNYFDHIRHPMDLGTIHKSIMTNDTYSLHTLDHDIMLMLSNCVKYNSIYNPDLVPYAKDLKSAWIAIRTDLLHRITYTEYTSTNPTTTIPKDILNPRLRAAWEEVTKQDPMQIFAYPVTDAIAPGYTRMIKEPMDLGTILKKLNKSVYTNLSGFDKDMELIFKNCIQFNGIHTTYGKLAVKLQNVWREQRRFIELDSMKSPSSSTLPSSVSTASELTPVPVKASSSAAAVSASVSLNTHTKDISSTSSHTNNTQSTIPLYTDTDTDASTSYKSTKMLSSNPPPSTSTPSSKQTNPSSTSAPSVIEKQNIPVIDKAKLSSVLQSCLDKLSSYDTQGIFAFPSDSKSIETPMDLSTMRVKTQKYKFKTMSLFHADVVIMIKNYLSLHADWKKRKYCRDFEEKWEQLYASEYYALYGEYPSDIDVTQLLLDKPINAATGSSHVTAVSTVTSTTLKESTRIPTTIVKLEPGLKSDSTLPAQTTPMKEPVLSEKGSLISSKEHTIKTDNAKLNVVPSSMSIKIKKKTSQVEIKQETAAVSNSSEKDSMIDPKDTQTNISSTTTTTTTSQKLLSDSRVETVHNSDMTMKKKDMELSALHHHTSSTCQDVIEDKSMGDAIDHKNSIPPSDSTVTTISVTPTTTISATPKPVLSSSTETHSSINQTTTTTSSSSSSSPRSSTALITTTSGSTTIATSQASNKNAALKAMLESTRNAMIYYDKLAYSADKINELPPIYTDGALLWGSLLLRDAGLQSACRTYIVNQLKTMITNVLDNTVDNILPHKDMNLPLALQICQLPYSPINQIMGTDQLLLRDVFPNFVIECVMGKEDNYKDVISVMKSMYNFLSDNNLSPTAENKTTSSSSSESSTNIVTSESKPIVPSAVTNQDVTKLMQKQIALTVMSQCIEKLRIK